MTCNRCVDPAALSATPDRSLDHSDRFRRAQGCRLAHGLVQVGVWLGIEHHRNTVVVALIEDLRRGHGALTGGHAARLIELHPQAAHQVTGRDRSP